MYSQLDNLIDHLVDICMIVLSVCHVSIFGNIPFPIDDTGYDGILCRNVIIWFGWIRPFQIRGLLQVM